MTSRTSATAERLRARFAAILGALVGSTSAVYGVASCGGALEDPENPSDPKAPRSLCGEARVPTFPIGVLSSPAQDYVAARFETAYMQSLADGGEGEEDFKVATSNNSGTPCASATNKQACRTTLDRLRLLPTGRAACEAKYPNVSHPGGTHPGCRVTYLVYTRGDDVGTAILDDEIRAFIGRIDNVAEAEWLLRKKYEPVCGGPRSQSYTVRELEAGFEFVFVNNCERDSVVRTVLVRFDGTMSETIAKAPVGTEFSCAVAGRRYDGFLPKAAFTVDPVEAYWRSMADLEAASVIAFERLATDLEVLEAPRDLIERARVAARDEARHAHAIGMLCRAPSEANSEDERAGAAPSPRALAIQNTREGVVREMFGALVAWHQATHAATARVRAVMTTIAIEETEHAALAIDIATWLANDVLGAEERAAVDSARAAAVDELRRELAVDPAWSVRAACGLPSARQAQRLLDGLSET